MIYRRESIDSKSIVKMVYEALRDNHLMHHLNTKNNSSNLNNNHDQEVFLSERNIKPVMHVINFKKPVTSHHHHHSLWHSKVLPQSCSHSLLLVVLTFLAILVKSSESMKLAIPRFFNQTDRSILTHLLTAESYNKHLRPHEGKPSLVNVSVILLTLFSPDESSLKYEVEFLMHQVWTDSRLRFDDEGRYSYLNALPVKDNMWIPDTYFILHGEFKYPTEPNDMALKIYPNGTVLYTRR